MLRLRNWSKWQRGILTNVRKMRRARGMDETAPLAMQHVSLTVSWDRDFIEKFSPEVGPRSAETFLLRTFQYVALHDGLEGRCLVAREEFGPIVLSRQGDHVGSKQGCKVYDALLASKIAVPIDGYVTGSDTGSGSGSALPVPARPVPSPPVLPGGSPSAPSNGHGAPLTDTERIMANAVITCLAQHVGCDDAEQRFGFEMRKAMRDNLAAPDDIREMIAKFGPRKGIRESVGLARNIARESV